MNLFLGVTDSDWFHFLRARQPAEVITDVYNRRCTVTGERVLPVLEAAHIRPVSGQGHQRSPTNSRCDRTSTACSTMSQPSMGRPCVPGCIADWAIF